MSVSNAIGTAAAVVGVGVAAAVGYKVFESARTAGQLNNAAADIRAAGGDPGALANIMAALRSTGILSPGKKGALVSQGTNEETQGQTTGVLYAAELAMLAAGSGARLSPNLTVHGARNDLSGWADGSGPALPSEALAARLDSQPTRVVRGLDMNAYALTFIDDCWPERDPNGHSLVVVPKSTPSWGVTAVVIARGRGNNSSGFMRLANVPALIEAGQVQHDLFLTSRAQGSVIAIWDRTRARFLTPAECQGYKVVVKLQERGSGYLYKGLPVPSGQRMTGSAEIWTIALSMKNRTYFQPFPPYNGTAVR